MNKKQLFFFKFGKLNSVSTNLQCIIVKKTLKHLIYTDIYNLNLGAHITAFFGSFCRETNKFPVNLFFLIQANTACRQHMATSKLLCKHSV